MTSAVRSLGGSRSWVGPRGGMLQVVVLDAAYDSLEMPQTQRLLPKIMSLKITGYQQAYPYGVLPVDVGDVIGTHLLLCEKIGETLDPIMGLKSVSAHRCKTHQVEFPALRLACPKELPEHHLSVRRKIDEIESGGERYAYSCSWTMAPIVRQDKSLARLCKAINMAFFVFYYGSYDIPHIFAGATLRFKVEEWKAFLGFVPMELEGKALPDFPCRPFFGERVRLMYLGQFTPAAMEFAKTYQALWDQRITIDAQTSEQRKAA